jgi:hypothetical protein
MRPPVADARQRQPEKDAGPAAVIGSRRASGVDAAALPSSMHLGGSDAAGLAPRAIAIACKQRCCRGRQAAAPFASKR